MTPAQRHWQAELNLLLHKQADFEDAGRTLPKKHYDRVRFVAACIESHNITEC